MKLSVSLPDEDVAFLDEYARDQGIDSRSAVVHRAVRLLKTSALSSAYAQAWDEWADAGEEKLWDAATPDGLGV